MRSGVESIKLNEQGLGSPVLGILKTKLFASCSRAIAALVIGLFVSTPPLSAQETTQSYRLAPGDRVTLSVSGQADLTGDFAIDASGNILLPIVGPVQISERTLEESRARIVTKLADGFLRSPNVSLRIAELRPIYVFGDVKTAGGYPFRPGVMALSAVALAGGFGVQETPTAGADYVQAVEAVRLLADQHRLLEIRIARIEAQLAGKSEFDFDVSKGGTAAALFFEQERELLKIQKSGLDEDVRLLQRQKPRLDAEVAAIDSQMEGERRQFVLVGKQLDDYSQVERSGFGRRPIQLTLQREQARLDANVSKLQSDRARLELMKGEVDIKINEAIQLYNRRLSAELQDARTKLREADAALPAAIDLRDLRLVQASGLAMSGNGPLDAHEFFISRQVAGNLVRTKVHGGALLEPGDIVEVTRVAPRVVVSKSASLAAPTNISVASNAPTQQP